MEPGQGPAPVRKLTAISGTAQAFRPDLPSSPSNDTSNAPATFFIPPSTSNPVITVVSPAAPKKLPSISGSVQEYKPPSEPKRSVDSSSHDQTMEQISSGGSFLILKAG
jgi:hypothetical protein